ncbi:MAG TPA: hypothetical protein VFW09_17870 [Solirubrobacteraceae bacterium]|nr:hypothetical protein [Solirubrobacteraceae bacterium]
MTLSSGVYSLIGVAVGSAATGGFQLALAIRGERRAERSARRNVTSELLTIEAVVGLAAEQRKVSTVSAERLRTTPMWERHCELLGQIRGVPWDLLDTAYADVPTLYAGLEDAARRGLDLPEETVAGLRRIEDRIAQARRALQGLPAVIDGEDPTRPSGPVPGTPAIDP